ncbi:MAG: hypothetical protein CMJ75_20105 [Planctomycetaceae bacterium]|nr:hypothetical protein [Planctomycetaceae bacterium]
MHRWLLFAALLTAVFAFTSAGRGRRTLSWLGTLLTAGLVATSLFWRTPSTPSATDPATSSQVAVAPQRPAGSLPRTARDRRFTTSTACRDCHQPQYDSWHATYHRTMTQVATPETVVPDLQAPVQLTARGRTTRIERRDDAFWVKMADPDWELQQRSRGVALANITNPPTVDRKIVMTTGSHHLQAYWIGGQDGGLRQVPWEFHIGQQRWLPVEDVFLRPPEAERMFSHWNSKCIQCHSVHGNPGWDPQSSQFKSEVVELGIACESCHGSGEAHIREQRAEPTTTVAAILNPRRQPAHISARICGQCHATFQPRDTEQFHLHGFNHRAGEPLEASRELATFDHPARPAMEKQGMSVYWGDRACRVGGAEYLGLLETACYQANQLSCVSCHSMHNSDPDTQLGKNMQGNQACLQCHQGFAEAIEEHTHHPAQSSGSQCYNCHMPHTSYALLTAMRSHRIDSPNVTSSLEHGRPNACNLCHIDKTLQWSANHLREWYQQPELSFSTDQREIAASLLWLITGDAMQRTLAAWHLGWSPAIKTGGDNWQASFLALLLDDPYPAVRFVAYQSIRRLPGFSEFEFDYLAPRSVRTAARQQVRQLLRSRTSVPPKPRAGPLLLDTTGQPLEDAVKRLLKQRNDRPVDIPE